MKKEELYEVLSDIDEEEIQKAGNYRKRRKPVWMAFAAVLVIAALVSGVAMHAHLSGSSAGRSPGLVTVLAEEPEKTAEGMDPETFLNDGESYWKWWTAYREKLDASSPLRAKMEKYYAAIMGKLLPMGDENTVCSPLSIYLALAMLAETAGGETQKEILDVLGASDTKELSSNVNALWESNCVDTPALKSHLANSIWLNNGYSFRESTLELLAKEYHASSFRGTAGSQEMDEALRAWTDANTGGLLKEYSKGLSVDPETVVELLSTVYYKASWSDKFNAEANTEEIFHGTKGDGTVEMMHREEVMNVYISDTFRAVSLNLRDGGTMTFCLPKEGVSVDALAGAPEVLKAAGHEGDRPFMEVRLSVPKFDISAETDLLETMWELGIQSALQAGKADFTPLVDGSHDLYVSAARHTARLSIDEEGVEGAAYTVIAMEEGAAMSDEVIDFILDRPFLYLVGGADGSVLFSGIVRNLG